LHIVDVRPYVSRSTLLGLSEELFITKLVANFSTDLLSLIPKRKLREKEARKALCMTVVNVVVVVDVVLLLILSAASRSLVMSELSTQSLTLAKETMVLDTTKRV